MATIDIELRFRAIEQRLDVVERELGIPIEAVEELEPPKKVSVAPVVFSQRDWLKESLNRKRNTHVTQSDEQIPMAVEVGSDAPLFARPRAEIAPAEDPVTRTPASSFEPLGYEAGIPSPKSAEVQSPLEQMIGLKLAGWVGAIVLVIGAGLGIKFAYDQGWLGGLPPAARLMLMYCAGFGLIAAGEYVCRKINAISAAGFFGAGVATLFLVSYAGNAYYGLYARQTAFVLMALATFIGAAVAMRGRLVSIAVLSLLGGYLSPLVLQGDRAVIASLGMYLLMLQVVALVLSWWGARPKWWALRGVSLAATTIWGVTMFAGELPWSAAMWFALVYAIMFQLEVVLTARRCADAANEGAAVAFSAIVSAIIAAAILWFFRHDAASARGIWMLAFSGFTLCIGIALQWGGGKRHVAAVGFGYRIQWAAFLVAAVPVALGGTSICMGWAGLAIALAAIGAKFDDRPSRGAAVCAWIFSLLDLLHLMASPMNQAAVHRVQFALLGQSIEHWATLACGLAFSGHLLAWLHGLGREDGKQTREPAQISAIASVLFVVAAIGSLPPLGASGVFLVYAWLLCGADLFRTRLGLGVQAAAVLALTAVKWVAIDTLAARFSPDWSAAQYTPVFNPMMLTGLAIAAMTVAMYRLRRNAIEALRERFMNGGAASSVVVLTIVSALMAFGLTFEVERVIEQWPHPAWPVMQMKLMAWTVLWTAALIVHLFVGLRLDGRAEVRRSWRRMGWCAIALLAIKFVFVDTMFWWGCARASEVAALLNLQTSTALALTGGMMAIYFMLRDDEDERSELGWRVGLAALAIVLWAGTLEIDRLVVSGVFPGTAIWSSWQLRQFTWTAWWTAGVTGYLALAHTRDATAIRRVSALRKLAVVPVLLATKYLVIDTMAFSLLLKPANATVVANLLTFSGAVVFGGLLLIREFLSAEPKNPMRVIAGALAVLMLLWLGTMEVDRAFVCSAATRHAFADPRLAEQVVLSIFFSAFAIGSVACGFQMRVAGLRYFGLALFAFTLMKVGVFDLRQAALGYRILSFMGLGSLLLFTSVLYGKLTPVLLGDAAARLDARS